MKTRQVVSTVAAILAALSLGCSTQRTARFVGTPSNLGNGSVASYAEFDKSGASKVIGVVFLASAPRGLRRGDHRTRQRPTTRLVSW